MKLDLRPRCKRCGKLILQTNGPKGKMAQREWERYRPFCSYHCQEWFRVEDALRYINSMRETWERENQETKE